jgi:hypothetical protein
MDAPKTKRAALTTRQETTFKPNDTPSERPEQATFAVLCTKSDGRRVPFQRYRTRIEADAVAEQLRRVGCAAIVEARTW